MHISSFYAVKQFLKPTMWHICHHLVWVHLGASVFICTYIILPPGLATSVLCIHCSSGQVAVLTIPVGSTNIRILHPLKPLEGTLGKWGKRTGKGRGQGREEDRQGKRTGERAHALEFQVAIYYIFN